jgi:6-phosphogluconolactonase
MNLTRIFDPSTEQLVALAADRTVSAVMKAWQADRDAHIVITGGRSGQALCKALDFALYRAKAVDRDSKVGEVKGKVHIWFSDERFVANEDPDRNDLALISNFKLAKERCNFHRMGSPADSSIEVAAKEYSEQLTAALGQGRFDVVLLSLGEDGHVASCFPHNSETLDSTNSTAAVTNSPKPPAQRITITLSQLARSSQIYVLAVGEAKRAALAATMAKSEGMPVELLRRNSLNGQVFVLTDLS